MKKRNILFGCLIATLSLALSACDFLPENFLPTRKSSSEESSQRVRPSRNPSSSNSEHVHKFSTEWSYNNVAHWHDSVCGHSVKSDVGEHEFYSAVVKEPTCNTPGEQVEICTVCDYERRVPIPTIDHSWHEYSRVEPTCYESGISRRYCTICGQASEEYLPPLGHDYQTISYQAPTCSEPGYEKLYCRRCGEQYEYSIPTSPHQWVNEYYSDAYEGNVGYYVSTCAVCNATRIAIRAQDGVLNGSYKTGVAFDYGFMKLNSNGYSVSYSFNYPSTAYGTLYQHAIFDQNPGNFDSYNYQTGNSSTGFNFDLSLNNQSIDLYQSAYITYGEFLNGGEEIPGVTYNGYSHAADCLIGDVSLQQGTNTMTYTRTGSYSLWVDYFVFVLHNSDHAHTISSYWNYDENSHWHACTDPNCPIPNARMDSSIHQYGERYVVAEATCYSEGLEREICEVCGYQHDIYIPATEHDYQSIGSFERTDDSVYMEEYCCSYCGQYALRWNAMEYDQSSSMYVEEYNGSAVRFQTGMAENLNGVEQTGSHIVYRIYSPSDQYNVGLAFYMYQSYGSSNSRVFDSPNVGSQGYVYDDFGNLVPSTKKYGLKVNGVEISLGEDIYEYVKNSGNNWYNWPVNFNLYAGLNTIDIYCLDSNYRARMYQFQITNTSYMAPNHVHTPNDYLSFDSYSHFNECTNGDGVRFNEEPHQFSEWVVTSEPTCENYGSQYRTCTICGYQEYSDIYPNGHNYEQYYVVQEPTCTEYGIQEAVCTVCGHVEQWSISPNGHSWDEGVVITEPSHDTNGAILYTCTICGAQETVVVPAGHTWSESHNVVGDAIQYECTICNAIYYELNVPSPQKLKQDITWDVSGLPAGTYEVILSACAASTTLSQNIVASGSGRYQFGFDYSDYTSPESGTYSEYGFGTGTSLSDVRWTNSLCEITAYEGVSTFTIHYGGQGYSAFISAVRLIRVA